MPVVGALFYAVAIIIMAAASVVVLVVTAVFSLLHGVAAFWKAADEFLGSPRSVEYSDLGASADPADPAYLAGPAWRDHWQLVGISFVGVYQRLLLLYDNMSSSLSEWSLRQQRQSEASITRLPKPFLGVGMGAGFALGFLGASAFVVATLSVQLVLLALVVAGTWLTSWVFWLLETGVLALRGITAVCGRCHQRLIRPVFVCPCGRAHRNLMPGKQGTFHRACRCARRLPTLLLLGKQRLTAKCGNCGAPLPRTVQSAPAYHLPIVGGIAAGKSVFVHTAIARLCHDHGRTVGLADEITTSRFAQGWELLRSGHFIPHSPFGQPIAYTVQFGSHLLYIYDAAGEVLEQSQHMAVSSFVDLSDGVVLVIDPFALPAVRARADAITLCGARPSEADPKAVLDVLVQTLQEYRGASATSLAMRVAVVITKADALLNVSDLHHPYLGVPAETSARTAAVRRWLIDQGHRDVVNSLHNHFGEVRYFIVTYLDGASVTPRPHVDGGPSVVNDDPAAPVRWLLTGTHL